jgi:chromosome segregation ATPase
MPSEWLNAYRARAQAEAEAEKDAAAAALREAQSEACKLKAEIARLEDEVKAVRVRESAASDMLAEKNAEIEALRAEHAVRAADRLAKDADAAAERAALMDTEQQLGRAEARVIALESYAKR